MGHLPHHRLDQILEAMGGVGVGKEEGRIFIDFWRRILEHLTQVSGKVFILDPPRKDILVGLAQVADSGGRMGSVVKPPWGPCPPVRWKTHPSRFRQRAAVDQLNDTFPPWCFRRDDRLMVFPNRLFQRRPWWAQMLRTSFNFVSPKL